MALAVADVRPLVAERSHALVDEDECPEGMLLTCNGCVEGDILKVSTGLPNLERPTDDGSLGKAA